MLADGLKTRQELIAELDALRVSYAILHQGERLSGCGSWDWDIARDTARFSEEWMRIHGVTRNNLSLEDLVQLTHPDDRLAVMTALRDALDGAAPFDIEYRILRQDTAETRVLHARAVVERDGRERPLAVRGNVQDITERALAARDLRRANAFLEQLIETASVLVVCLDKDGQVLICNKAVEDVTGFSRQDIVGRSWFSTLVPRERFPETWEVFQKISRDGQVPELHTNPIVTKSGQERQIAWRNSRFPGQGGQFFIVSFGQDITFQREAMRELEQSKERLQTAMEAVEAASKAKSEFLANMSHEIRTPLSAILGLAQLSQRLRDPAKTATHLNMIADSAHNLLAIVGDVLDLSRVEAGKMQLESKPFSLRALLERIVSSFALACREKGLELHLAVDPHLPDSVRGDSTRLGQVLTNLVSNALKFTSSGSIRVQARLSGSSLPGLVMPLFSVADTGAGISPEHTAIIFDSFRQVDSSYSKGYQGAGLGLAICRELTGLMGGRIWVESQPGQGSTFLFTAVLQPAAPAEADGGGAVPREATAPARVLLAEDNPFNRHVFEQYLSLLGHRVVCAVDGQEALDRLREQDFDLAFMDVQMPRMDGMEAVGRIRAGECGQAAAAMPVVALTAYAMQGDRERFIAAGMTDYLAKPVSLEAIQEAVGRFTGSVGRSSSGRQALQGVKEACRPLLGKFLDFIRQRSAQARDLLEDGDFEAAARAGHDIKGASQTFGVEGINRCGQQLEAACRAGDAHQARQALGGLESLVVEAQREAVGMEQGDAAATAGARMG